MIFHFAKFRNLYCNTLLMFLPVFIFLACSSDKLSGTIDDTDTGIVAILSNPDGSPASGATIKVFKTMDSTKIPVLQVLTDKNGRYNLSALTKGTYNVYSQKDSLVAFQDSITVLTDTALINNDTLERPRSLTAIVGLQPNHDPRTVTVQVLGTDIYSNVDENGRFTLHKLATENYTLKLSTTLDNYTNTFRPITIKLNSPDTLTDTLWLIYTGIPVVENIKVTYDTLIGVVKLSWKSSKYRDFQDYLIYRDHYNSINLSQIPIALTNDTIFNDTIFQRDRVTGGFSLSDTNDYHFKYRIAIRNTSQVEGMTYKNIDVIAAAPQKVLTVIKHQSFQIKKGFFTDSASVNDTIRFTLDISNRTRELKSVKYTDLRNNSVINSHIVNSVKQIKDTLYLVWDTIGIKKFEVSVEDVAGTISKDTIIFKTINNFPEISIKDTSIYRKVPFILNGFDKFGKIVNFSVDTGKFVHYRKLSDSAIEVTISDTLTNSFKLSFRIVNDDGNCTDKLIVLKMGILWSKIADNFLDTNYIRSVVELNNTLYAFVTSCDGHVWGEKYNYNNSLYSSTDGVNWKKALDSVPWTNWFTKPVVHNNKIFLIEAVNDSTDTNKIWFSDNGTAWESTKLHNLPKWQPILMNGHEMLFVSLNGKLWTGSKNFYGDNTYTEFLNSSDGITWISVKDQCSPPDILFASDNPTLYTVHNQKLIYVIGMGIFPGLNDSGVFETTDFITYTKLCKIDLNKGGSFDPPTPISFLDQIILCPNIETIYGKNIIFLKSDGTQINFESTYPGGFFHSCIVFRGKLYSISNNGVFVME